MSFWLFQYLKSMGDNFGVVVPGHIYRSAQPSALCELRDKYGIRAVLNLRDNAGPKERRDAEKAGLFWHQIPMKDDAAPTPDQIRDALDVLRSGVPVLVHCKGGRHRTGLVVAVYRVIVQKWTKKAAWDEAYEFGFYRFGHHGPLEDWFLKLAVPLWNLKQE